MLKSYTKRLFLYVKSNPLFVAWVVAVVAMLGSISLSELWGLVPCKLCWYQRYLMIAVIVLLGVAEYKKLPSLYKIVLPLTAAGAGVALYHSLLQWGFVTETLSCAIDAPCALAKINWFGFITIPFMSLMVFVVITGLLIVHHRQLAAEASDES